MTFKEFLAEQKKKKKNAKKQIADFDVERTDASYRASNAMNAQGMGRGIK